MKSKVVEARQVGKQVRNVEKITNDGYWRLVQMLNREAFYSPYTDNYWQISDSRLGHIRKSLKYYLSYNLDGLKEILKKYSGFVNVTVGTHSLHKRQRSKDRVATEIYHAVKDMINDTKEWYKTQSLPQTRTARLQEIITKYNIKI